MKKSAQIRLLKAQIDKIDDLKGLKTMIIINHGTHKLSFY